MWGVKLTGPWGKMEALLKDGPKAVEREIKRATRFNAMKVVRAVRENIRSGDHEENAELTVGFKGSTKPLVDKGELFKAITYTIISDTRAEVGVMKSSSTANYALAVHEGATIKVTPAMRGLFHALARYSVGDLTFSQLGERAQELAKRMEKSAKRSRDKKTGRFTREMSSFKPIKESTTRIRIPGRPYLREVVEDARLQREVMENWSRAVAYALSGRPSPPMK